MGRRAGLTLFAIALLSTSILAGVALAAPSDVAQKPGTAGCISAAGGACAVGAGIDRPESIAISPDGKSLYVASQESSSVAVFDRAADGGLTQKAGAAGCISQSGAPPCGKGKVLLGASGVAVSPDGASVYVTSRSLNGIAVFDRDSNGTLTQKAGADKGCISATGDFECAEGDGLLGPKSVAVSPGGSEVYVSGWTLGSDTIAVLDRAGDGSLTSSECLSEQGTAPCADIEGMVSPEELTISPDGENVYVASSLSDSVAYFERDDGDGSLSYLGCRSSEAVTPCANGVESLDGAYSVAVSPDGGTVYTAAAAAGTSAVSIFDRDPEDGSLSIKGGAAGCISIDPSTDCADGIALHGAASIAISPDGTSAYVASIASGSLTAFDRASDGTLAQSPPPNGCFSYFDEGPCKPGIGLLAAHAVAVSPDNRNVYVASPDDSIAIFDRGPSLVLPPQPPPAPDTTAPKLDGLSISPSKFLAAAKGASASAKTGAKVAYKLSEPASVKFGVEQALPGRRAGKKCVKQTAGNQDAKKCTRYKTVKGSFTQQGKSGSNTFKFSGRLKGKRLKPGKYRLTAAATDAAGNAAKDPTRRGFQIAAP